MKASEKKRLLFQSKKKVFYGLCSILLLLAGTLILLMWDKVFPYAYTFSEAFLSYDHQISNPMLVSIIQFFACISCFFFGLLLLAKIWFPKSWWLNSMIDQNQASLWCGLGVIFSIFLLPTNHEDSMELLTALLLTGSGLVAVFLMAKYRETDQWFILGIGLFFIFLGMEELSWGQHLFDWQTPEALMVFNDQNEINLHNLDNMILMQFNFFAPLTVVLFLVIGNSIALSQGRFARFVHLPQFIGFIPSLLISLIYNPAGEIIERLGSVMAVFYVIHLWRTRCISPL